ncbi:amidase [Pseudomaricurvus alkylphenolicus]|uniref:amidase n=1 Tax=Pseudomaricurvus alkylphenolicus TaxID=1306991 RepID=UPI0014224086|nr:amidase [Pseudomaricurvus alkylphenolicus]NIB41509.1 amidase [Pseudomaricurvus alkylphenolicus]
MSLDSLCQSTIGDIAPLLANKDISPIELTQAMLERIAHYDDRLHSYVTVTQEKALQQAKSAEREILSGNYRSALHGIPLAVKDLFNVENVETACASTILRGNVPDQDATAVRRLHEAGAINLGKLSMTEFAQGGYHPSVEPPINPWNPEHWSGLSSSGSAVATAASLCFGALGTDTGGSIRFPAASCGVVGLKPTYGRVSRHGAFPLAESLDHVGPMTRSVKDAALILQAIVSGDEKDPSSLDAPVPDYFQEIDREIKGLRIGVDEHYCTHNVDPRVSAAVFAAVDQLVHLGAERVNVDLSGVIDICHYWYPVTATQAAATHRDYYPARAQDYGPTFRALLEWGHRYSAQDISQALPALNSAWQSLNVAFGRADIIACPSMAMPAPPAAAFPPDMVAPPETIAPLLHFCAPYNFTGHPTLSLPCGFADELPLSLQLIGRHQQEATILRAAHHYQQATTWHQRRPTL